MDQRTMLMSARSCRWRLLLLAACLLPPRPVAAGGAPSSAYRYRGVILPAREITVRAPADARVVKVHAAVGQRVDQGQPLIELELDDLQARRAEARAQFQRAAAQLKRVEDTLARAERGERELRIGQRRARAIRQQLDRLNVATVRGDQGPATEGSMVRAPIRQIARQRAADGLKRLDSGLLRVRMERARLETLRRDLADATSTARTAWKTAETAVRDYARIAAPIDGVVSECEPSPSERVSPGQELLKIIQTDRVKAVLWIPPDRLSEWLDAAQVQLRQDGPGQVWHAAAVPRLSAATEPRTGCYVAEVELVNRGLRFRPGRHVEARLVRRSPN